MNLRYARALRLAFYLALVGVVVAEGQANEGESCDWYCWVEEKIAWLMQEVLKIEGLMVRSLERWRGGIDVANVKYSKPLLDLVSVLHPVLCRTTRETRGC